MVSGNLKKNGFTLMEIVIAMVILSVFLMTAAKIFTIKPARQLKTALHGFAECYYDIPVKKSEDGEQENAKLYYHSMLEKTVTDVNSEITDGGDYCKFKPSRNVGFYTIVIIHPKKAENNELTGYMDSQPSISNELYLYPADSQLKVNNESASTYDYIDYSYDTLNGDEDHAHEIVQQDVLLQALSANLGDDSEVVQTILPNIKDDTEYKGAIIIYW